MTNATIRLARKERGIRAYYAGDAAERSVESLYQRHGYRLAARRWRGRSGEIDLVFREGRGLVFVEVKQSRSFASAAERLSPRQQRRIAGAAQEFVSGAPAGQLTPVRFDAALVNGAGEIRILENVTLTA